MQSNLQYPTFQPPSRSRPHFPQPERYRASAGGGYGRDSQAFRVDYPEMEPPQLRHHAWRPYLLEQRPFAHPMPYLSSPPAPRRFG